MATVETSERTGTASELHNIDPFAEDSGGRPAVWICRASTPAIVLGSRQTPQILDLDACASAGLEVARRRSGGGAVLVRPRAICWLDVILPHGIAPDDVRGSMLWMGDLWCDAFLALGAERSALAVHRAAPTWTPWSDRVCFAGLGPGELVVAGGKLVGLSQRRTRHGLRIQCQVHRHDLLAETATLFSGPTPDDDIAAPALLGDVVAPDVDNRALADALASCLATRMTRV